MKLVITSSGSTLDSAIDPRFGRAAQFIQYDTETQQFTAHDNAQNLNAAQGAGIQAAQTVEKVGADWLLTGHCGPKAFRVLEAAGIQVAVGQKGTVAEVIARFMQGDVKATETADVEGHWA